jgi:hypothetical protein
MNDGDHLVTRGMKTIVANVNGVMARVAQQARHFWRERVVD